MKALDDPSIRYCELSPLRTRLQRVTACCGALQCVAACCSVLQRVAAQKLALSDFSSEQSNELTFDKF